MEPEQSKSEDIKLNSNLPISKNMLKKLKRKEEWESKKSEIRKAKKQKKKDKKLKEQVNTETVQNNNNLQEVHLPRKVREEQYLNKVDEGIVLIMDCGFEELMNEKDISSLVRQIAFCYSANRKSEIPFNYILYDVGDKVMEVLNKNNFDKWVGVKLIKKGEYKSLDEFILNYTDSKYSKEKIVYLTADSENELNDLNNTQVYIIGGIVDRNRFKSITYNKAKELGLGHGKLPIGDYIHLNSSKVLTTNHAFSILSYYINVQKNWKEAFLSIIPKRKLDENIKLI